ncbi:hypothetical protein HNR42_000714 [Deinobacterium chartae]|uniref:Uncharacterized protein n=1 Tax=Deinobacterium chartae TaxID=521158 RepID=A0A841HYK3_9DEIO|nr:hypothetical protein [Deinobacterium chartae]MBB6097300.1 hypothetical protein [Deinobacterium chartae]
MNRTVPDALLNFWLPDLYFDGAEVVTALRDMPAKAHPLQQRTRPLQQRTRLAAAYRTQRERDHSGRTAVPVDARVVTLLFHAVGHLHGMFARFRRTWPLESCNVMMTVHPESQLASVTFLSKVEDWMEGPIMEDFPGVSFFLDLEDGALLRTMYMR